MGKISDALKDTTLPIETKRKVIALDKEFSEQQSQIQVLQSAKPEASGRSKSTQTRD